MNSTAPKYPLLLWLEKHIELPMLFLGFVWFCILIIELAYGTNPTLSGLGTGTWILFILYFIMRLLTAAKRLAFLRRNWLFVVAILIALLRFFPFLHAFPLVRAVTATFGMQVVWIFASADQGMRSLRRVLGRRGAGYALAFTFVVMFAGAAGMLHFEGMADDPQSIRSYYPVNSTYLCVGDIVLFMTQQKEQKEALHSAVFIADNIVFTKNGVSDTSPWMLATIEDLVDLYSFSLPEGQSVKLYYFRHKDR